MSNYEVPDWEELTGVDIKFKHTQHSPSGFLSDKQIASYERLKEWWLHGSRNIDDLSDYDLEILFKLYSAAKYRAEKGKKYD